jgi:hypothetical protein
MQTEQRPDLPPSSLATAGPRAAQPRPRPVLASEALREDLAPLEPGRTASRVGGCGLAVAFLGIAIALRAGLGGGTPNAASIAFAAAAATGVGSALPLSYLARAAVGATVGLAVALLGLRGVGPLGLLALAQVSTPVAEFSRVLAATAVPAALLFRAHYRAYRRGHVLLGLAIACSVPFAMHALHTALWSTELAERTGALLAIGAIVSGLFGFFGAATPRLTAWWAELLTVCVAADVGLRELYAAPPPLAGPLPHLLTAVGFVAAASPLAVGLFQALAALYARDARRVDVHRPAT